MNAQQQSVRFGASNARRWAAGMAVLVLGLTSIGQLRAQEISLPTPAGKGDLSVEEAIATRRSVRSFADEPLTLEEIAQLLWAAVGVTADGTSGPTRAAASAGGLYPVDVFIAVGDGGELDAGVYRYLWRDHEVEQVHAGDVRERLQLAAFGETGIEEAPATLILAADYTETARRYGERGVERYVHMDAGHTAQNVLLQARALGLGATPIGAFGDSAVKQLLRTELEPLYLIPVGRPG